MDTVEHGCPRHHSTFDDRSDRALGQWGRRDTTTHYGPTGERTAYCTTSLHSHDSVPLTTTQDSLLFPFGDLTLGRGMGRCDAGESGRQTDSNLWGSVLRQGLDSGPRQGNGRHKTGVRTTKTVRERKMGGSVETVAQVDGAPGVPVPGLGPCLESSRIAPSVTGDAPPEAPSPR